MATEPLWSVEEAAAYLGLTVKALYMLRYRGDAPKAARVGRRLKFRPQTVRAWVAEREKANNGAA